MNAAEISDMINGTIYGDPMASCSYVCDIQDKKTDTISFLFSSNYIKYIYETKSNIVVVSERIFNLIDNKLLKFTIISVKDARKAFYYVLKSFYNEIKKQTPNIYGISDRAFVSQPNNLPNDIYIGEFSTLRDNISIGKNCKIYPNVYISDDVEIGDNVVIHPFTTINSKTIIGNNCFISSGSKIGGLGFGFFFDKDKAKNFRIPHLGGVIIEDNVEIGSNVTIDRAIVRHTIIRKGVKIDSQVHVGHNVDIGQNTIIVGATAIGGSTKIGKNCMIGGQVGISDNVIIGNNVRILAKSGIFANVKDNQTLQGIPALDHYDFKKAYVRFKNLDVIFDYFNEKK